MKIVILRASDEVPEALFLFAQVSREESQLQLHALAGVVPANFLSYPNSFPKNFLRVLTPFQTKC